MHVLQNGRLYGGGAAHIYSEMFQNILLIAQLHRLKLSIYFSRMEVQEGKYLFDHLVFINSSNKVKVKKFIFERRLLWKRD